MIDIQASYLKTAVKGLSWISALRGGSRAINLGKTAVLARVLMPAQFGAFGIAALAIALMEILTETGINVFLLQEKKGYEKYLDTAWVVSIFRGIIISAVVFVSSDFVAAFFAIPEAGYLLALASLVPFIRGFINPACVRFQKDLQFGREFVYRFTILLVEVFTAISLALAFRSADSLVISMIVAAGIEVLLSFTAISPRPKFAFNLVQAKKVISRGKWVTGFGIFDFLFSQGDNIAVGRLLGAAPLGVYQNAYKLATLPISEINDVFYKVTFPIYVKLSEEKDRLRSAITRHFLVVSSLMLLAGGAMFVFAKDLVLILLGPNWLEAVDVVRVLAFLGVARGISFSFNSLFMALKQQKYVTLITFVSFSVLALAIIPAVKTYGILGAAMAASLGSVLALPVAIYLIVRTLRRI